uniref:Uncharacterized protein n=1 Tax=Oryza brachyantha TaxID=4533 RepID=J3NBN1_ORYBR
MVGPAMSGPSAGGDSKAPTQDPRCRLHGSALLRTTQLPPLMTEVDELGWCQIFSEPCSSDAHLLADLQHLHESTPVQWFPETTTVPLPPPTSPCYSDDTASPTSSSLPPSADE